MLSVMEIKVFLGYISVIIFLFLFGRMLLIPLKKLIKLVLKCLAGACVLIALNLFSASAGVSVLIPLNIITAAAAGLLGLPGVAALIIYFAYSA